jgi:hypothetical protein
MDFSNTLGLRETTISFIVKYASMNELTFSCLSGSRNPEAIDFAGFLQEAGPPAVHGIVHLVQSS